MYIEDLISLITKLKFPILIFAIIISNCSCSNKASSSLEVSSSKSLIIQSPQESSQVIDRIKSIARKSTVVISLGGSIVGSGVIIGKNDNTLYILTVRHAIGIAPSQIEDPYKITTPTGDEFQVGYENYERVVSFLPNDTDLAILTLKSKHSLNNEDNVAKLSSAVIQKMPIYVFSYVPCSLAPEIGADSPTQVSIGEVLNIESKSKVNSDRETSLKGYDIHYNNNTVVGMSGSPVFDMNGRVIAIHAKTDNSNKVKPENCKSLPSEPSDDLGDNWGISIRSFNNLKSELHYNLLSKLEIDERPLIVKYSSKSNTQSSTQPSASPCAPFIGEGYSCTVDGK